MPGPVVNLGQFGQPRESDLAPAARGMTRGIEHGLKASALKTELAGEDYDKKKQGQENTYRALEDLSNYMHGLKSDEEREMFRQGEHYKQVSTLVKEYLPEYYDKDSKQVMILSHEKMFKTKLTKMRSDIATTIEAGGTLTEAQQKTKDFLDEVGPELAAKAMSLAIQEHQWDWDTLTEAQKASVVERNVRLLKRGVRSQYSTGLGNEGAVDPLGILNVEDVGKLGLEE